MRRTRSEKMTMKRRMVMMVVTNNEGEEDVVLRNARGRMSRLDQDFHRQAGSCPMEI